MHFMDTSSDIATITNENEEVLYSIDSSAYLFNSVGERIGYFRTDENNNWFYEDYSNNIINLNSGNDLLSAERELVSKLLIKGVIS